jgi:transcriptional regulatory protein LEU3
MSLLLLHSSSMRVFTGILWFCASRALFSQLLRPKFIPLLDESQQKSIIASVRKLIQVLGSDSVALDDRHAPAIYSHFLSCQLARHNVLPDSDRNTNTFRTEDTIPQYRQDLFAWPDTGNVQQHAVECAGNFQSGIVLQQYGEADMDFSVRHFMDTVLTHSNMSSKNLRPEEIADWPSVNVNVVDNDVTEADTWMRTLY